MTTEQQIDPMDAAMNAVAPVYSKMIFGEVQVQVWPCAFEKDAHGKTTIVPFDAMMHQPEMRRIRIEVLICPVRGQFNTERKLIAESNEWVKIMMPSLKTLGMDLRSINGRFVRAELVPTGRSGKRQVTQPDGSVVDEERQYTTLAFREIYPDMESCATAANAAYGSHVTVEAGQPTGQPGVADRHPTALGNTNNEAAAMERATAEKFLVPLWGACRGDRAKFIDQLTSNPVLSKHFTADSPEIVKLLAA